MKEPKVIDLRKSDHDIVIIDNVTSINTPEYTILIDQVILNKIISGINKERDYYDKLHESTRKIL